MRYAFLIICILSITVDSYSSEREYQAKWCDRHDGVMEYRLFDKTRVDCLTKTHAIEVDFGKKWAEAIGQSLYYAAKTGKRAGIVLILEKAKDDRFLRRLNSVIENSELEIDVWVMHKSDLIN